jgi:uncharacterized membrane protein
MDAAFTEIAQSVAVVIDALGVLVIVIGIIAATVRMLGALRRSATEIYRRYREDLGRGILLGLEFLVAADIIRTVAVAPTLRGVLVLGIIVVIRTFLSMAIEVELEGRWPWQRGTVPPRGPE